MKKFSLIAEKKKQEIIENGLVNERNLYLEFSKKYHKEHGVSGPFDKKFQGDKKKQEEYMEALGKAWDEHKEKKGIKDKKKGGKFDFAKKKMNESKATEMAKEMIGDGGEPNYFFVTMSDDYMFEVEGEMKKYSSDPGAAPLKIKTTFDMGLYTFGPFQNMEEAKMFSESIELDEINGPRSVMIQDRKNGEVLSRFLTCKLQPVWNEEVHGEEGEEEDDDTFVATQNLGPDEGEPDYETEDEVEDEDEIEDEIEDEDEDEEE